MSLSESYRLGLLDMVGPFATDVQDFLISRSDRLDAESMSCEYGRAAHDNVLLQQKLIALIGANEQQLFFEIEENQGKKEVALKELMYKQGFSDGIRFIMQSLWR